MTVRKNTNSQLCLLRLSVGEGEVVVKRAFRHGQGPRASCEIWKCGALEPERKDSTRDSSGYISASKWRASEYKLKRGRRRGHANTPHTEYINVIYVRVNAAVSSERDGRRPLPPPKSPMHPPQTHKPADGVLRRIMVHLYFLPGVEPV